MNITESHITKIMGLLDHGLVHGLGKPEPGQMCVEAMICYALDLPHGDDPGRMDVVVSEKLQQR